MTATMNAVRDIATMLGDAVRAGREWRCRCPVCGSKTLLIATGKTGKVVYKCFGGCSQTDVLTALRRLSLLPAEPSEQAHEPRRQRAESDEAKEGRAVELFQLGKDAGTIVETYLRGRGLALPTGYHDVIRYHPACPFKGERVPAMVALLRDIITNQPCGIHRTALLADGSGRDRERGKAMLGRVKGACIKLCDDSEVEMGLGITEGIETALAIIGNGWRPIWAAGSAGSIKTFPVLPGVEELTVFADHDENGTGERAAEECARRWAEAGKLATVRIRNNVGADWADAMGAI
jgi:hypothetical protein